MAALVFGYIERKIGSDSKKDVAKAYRDIFRLLNSSVGKYIVDHQIGGIANYDIDDDDVENPCIVPYNSKNSKYKILRFFNVEIAVEGYPDNSIFGEYELDKNTLLIISGKTSIEDCGKKVELKKINNNSNCCGSFVYVDGDEEGTHYYVCSKCHKPCDIKA